jgi:hypothetical protein
MRVTRLRTKSGSKLTELQMQHLVVKLAVRIKKAGFVTGVDRISGSSIKIGLRMKSFTVDVSKLGYNARSAKRSIKGYMRTSIPTWEQREQFNHIVNDVLDSLKYSGHIVSGDYLIRDKRIGRMNSWERPEGTYNTYSGEYQEHPLLSVVSESEAINLKRTEDNGLTVENEASMIFKVSA